MPDHQIHRIASEVLSAHRAIDGFLHECQAHKLLHRSGRRPKHALIVPPLPIFRSSVFAGRLTQRRVQYPARVSGVDLGALGDYKLCLKPCVSLSPFRGRLLEGLVQDFAAKGIFSV